MFVVYSQVLFCCIDIIDSSGMRMRLTRKLRHHEVVGLNIGATVINYQVVPPQEKAFVSRAYCAAECIEGVSKYKIIRINAHYSLPPHTLP